MIYDMTRHYIPLTVYMHCWFHYHIQSPILFPYKRCSEHSISTLHLLRFSSYQVASLFNCADKTFLVSVR